jgi:hypothetical protein
MTCAATAISKHKFRSPGDAVASKMLHRWAVNRAGCGTSIHPNGDISIAKGDLGFGSGQRLPPRSPPLPGLWYSKHWLFAAGLYCIDAAQSQSRYAIPNEPMNWRPSSVWTLHAIGTRIDPS